MDGEIDLFKIVQTRHPTGPVMCAGQNRQQQCDQDGNDGNDHQQFDKGKCEISSPAASLIVCAHNFHNTATKKIHDDNLSRCGKWLRFQRTNATSLVSLNIYGSFRDSTWPSLKTTLPIPWRR